MYLSQSDFALSVEKWIVSALRCLINFEGTTTVTEWQVHEFALTDRQLDREVDTLL
jgi:hypothetical protein